MYETDESTTRVLDVVSAPQCAICVSLLPGGPAPDPNRKCSVVFGHDFLPIARDREVSLVATQLHGNLLGAARWLHHSHVVHQSVTTDVRQSRVCVVDRETRRPRLTDGRGARRPATRPRGSS